MRRSSSYTIPFPDPVPPPPELYLEHFSRFPFWYRWYLRVRALLGGRSVVAATRAHHLAELRRRLDRVARESVDCGVPALLPGFHLRIRSLRTHLLRVGGALAEATGAGRATFLADTFERVAPELAEELDGAGGLPAEAAADPHLSLVEARALVRTQMEQALEREIQTIERQLGPLWNSLRTLNLLERVDLEGLLPVQGARREQTPLRVVADILRYLHQCLELCHQHINPEATEQAWEFARRRIRSRPGPPRAIWSEIEELRSAVPLLDLLRFAAGEPFLSVPSLSIRSDWWTPFRDEWIRRGLARVAGELAQARRDALHRILVETYLIDRDPPAWIPSPLHPHTTGHLLLLAASEFFHDTRRVVTQLVIDADFYHLDTRNSLHHAALQLDQELERLRSLLGEDDHQRGSLGDEIQRLQQRSATTAIAHRQLTGLYERYRPRVRTSIENLVASMETVGHLISRTQDGSDRAYEITELHSQSFSAEHDPHELLGIVARVWPVLARELSGMYRLEDELNDRIRS